jgi:hypothetical protein
MKTYDFKSFCRGDLVEKVEPKPVVLYSSILPFTVPYVLKAMFLNTGVALVGTVGAVAVGLAWYELRLAKKGDDVNADKVAMIGGTLLPMFAGGMVIWFIVKLGGMFL